MVFAFQIFLETSTAVFSSFICILFIISIAISLLTKCSSGTYSAESSCKEVLDQKGSTTIGSEGRKRSGTNSKTHRSTKGKTRGSSAQQRTPRNSTKSSSKKQRRTATKSDAQSSCRPLKKENAEATTVQGGATDFINAAKTTNLQQTKKEEAQASEAADDGAYEDVNLSQAAEAPKRVVTVEPTSASFPTAGGKSTFTVLNGGADRLVFKVKCSNNKDYRIKPVYGFMDPDGSHLIWVLRLPAAAKDDKMVIQWLKASSDTVDPVNVFKTAKLTDIQGINVPLIGVAGDGGASDKQGKSTPAPATSPSRT